MGSGDCACKASASRGGGVGWGMEAFLLPGAECKSLGCRQALYLLAQPTATVGSAYSDFLPLLNCNYFYFCSQFLWFLFVSV